MENALLDTYHIGHLKISDEEEINKKIQLLKLKINIDKSHVKEIGEPEVSKNNYMAGNSEEANKIPITGY